MTQLLVMNASGTGEKGVNSVTPGHHPPNEPERRRRCVRVRVCACARAYVLVGACVRARACARVPARACVSARLLVEFAINDNYF